MQRKQFLQLVELHWLVCSSGGVLQGEIPARSVEYFSVVIARLAGSPPRFMLEKTSKAPDEIAWKRLEVFTSVWSFQQSCDELVALLEFPHSAELRNLV